MVANCLRVICLIAALFTLASGSKADPPIEMAWPNWMGPNHDGISRETGLKTKWPSTGLPVRWTRDVGIGFSSIAIAQGRLFTMGHVDGQEVVWCLNVDSGETIWEFRYPSELNDNLHEGGPGATPTINGDFVYTLGKEGQLYCFDFQSGKVIWESILPKELKVPVPEWGYASSPVIAGNHLLLQGGRVVSYDKRTGKKNWQSETHEAGYGSAAVFPQAGGTCIATLDCDGLRISRLETGDELDFVSWPSPYRTNSTTPIVVGNRIFISSAYNVGCALFEFVENKLKLVYSNREMRNHFNNSILWDGFLYGFDGNSNLGRVVQLTCMKFDTGEVAWKQRGMGCGSLMIADKKLLILSEKGTLSLANATPARFEELTQSPFLEGRCWTVPVLLKNHVYGRNAAGKLVCVKLP